MTHREFLIDMINELLKKIVVVERELALLDQAQRPTPADMAQQIIAHPGEPSHRHVECRCVTCDAHRTVIRKEHAFLRASVGEGPCGCSVCCPAARHIGSISQQLRAAGYPSMHRKLANDDEYFEHAKACEL